MISSLHGNDLIFEGIERKDFFSRTDSITTILSGNNNSGKTLVLKHLLDNFHCDDGADIFYCGSNRYYNLDYFSRYHESHEDFQLKRYNIVYSADNEELNHDPTSLSFDEVFIRLTDSERESVYEVCSKLLGVPVSLNYVSPSNSLSNSYIRIGDTPLMSSSSGSRMLLYLISILFCKRYGYLIIDEPELCLTPRIQDSIQDLIFNKPDHYLTHIKHIYIATHSHIFLNRNKPNDNFSVSRNNKVITVKRLSTYHEFIDLQFNQLGNNFRQLQLPTGFIILEGKTDYAFIKRLILLKSPNSRINLSFANGDGEVKNKLRRLLDITGNLRSSPYYGRIFVVVDGKHSPTLKSDLEKMGLPKESFIEWKLNGIEYYYPISILQHIFRDTSLEAAHLNLDKDRVSHNEIVKTKDNLNKEVIERLSGSELLSEEIEQFIDRVHTLDA